MSVEAMAVVLHHSPSKATDKLILLGIANHHGDGGAWPSVATLAKYANINIRNTKAALRRLEEAGEITRHDRQGGTMRTPDHLRPNMYDINVRCPDDCDRTTAHRSRKQKVSRATPAEDGPVPSATGGVASDTGGGVASDTGGVSPATPEPSLNPPMNHPFVGEMDPLASSSRNVPRASARAAAADSIHDNQEPDQPAAADDVDEAGDSPASPPVVGVLTPQRPSDPAGILDAALLTRDEATSFRQWLRDQTGATNPDGLIVSLSRSGELSARIVQWRDSEPVNAPHSAAQTPTAAQPTEPAARPAWCGRCDDTTRLIPDVDENGREIMRRCPTCNPRAGQLSPGGGASVILAADATQAERRNTGAGRAAFLAARGQLPAGTGRRITAHDTATRPVLADDGSDQ